MLFNFSRIPRSCLCMVSIILSEINYSQIYYIESAAELGIEYSFSGDKPSGGVSFYDFDNDGWDDITIASGEGEELVFYKNSEGHFERIEFTGLDDKSEVRQVLWVDYDNDGDEDIFVTSSVSPNKLYNNDGEMNFVEVTEIANLPLENIPTQGAAWGDYNNDGFLDLYTTDRQNGDGYEGILKNHLFMNNQDGTFSEVTQNANVGDEGKAPWCAGFLDFDNDGWQDIYVAQDKRTRNSLFRNNGDGTFEDISVPTNSDLRINSMSVTMGDYDNNGFVDIYITNTSEGNKLLRNNGDLTFTELAEDIGVGFHGVGWSAQFLDSDNDGDLDLYVSGSLIGSDVISSHFYENIDFDHFILPNNAGFEADTVVSYSNAVGDINNDGYPDIVVNNPNPFATVIWQNSGGNNQWIKIKLIGKESNRNGVGSRIEVFSNGTKYLRTTHCGEGFLGQNSGNILFGIGNSIRADSILIHWPSGNLDILREISSGQSITVAEGSTDLPPFITAFGPLSICEGDSVELNAGFYESYNWSNGEKMQSILIKESGEYFVTVTDIYGNSATSDTVTIQVMENTISLSLLSSPSEAGENNGTATVIATGGLPPYLFNWNNSNQQTDSIATDLEPGIYSVTVQDSWGCMVQSQIEVVAVITSINRFKDSNVRVYPNPVTNHINLHRFSDLSESHRIKIIDLSGRTVLDQIHYNSGKRDFSINTSSLKPGFYLLFITAEEGQIIYNEKIILK